MDEYENLDPGDDKRFHTQHGKPQLIKYPVTQNSPTEGHINLKGRSDAKRDRSEECKESPEGPLKKLTKLNVIQSQKQENMTKLTEGARARRGEGFDSYHREEAAESDRQFPCDDSAKQHDRPTHVNENLKLKIGPNEERHNESSGHRVPQQRREGSMRQQITAATSPYNRDTQRARRRSSCSYIPLKLGHFKPSGICPNLTYPPQRVNQPLARGRRPRGRNREQVGVKNIPPQTKQVVVENKAVDQEISHEKNSSRDQEVGQIEDEATRQSTPLQIQQDDEEATLHGIEMAEFCQESSHQLRVTAVKNVTNRVVGQEPSNHTGRRGSPEIYQKKNNSQTASNWKHNSHDRRRYQPFSNRKLKEITISKRPQSRKGKCKGSKSQHRSRVDQPHKNSPPVKKQELTIDQECSRSTQLTKSKPIFRHWRCHSLGSRVKRQILQSIESPHRKGSLTRAYKPERVRRPVESDDQFDQIAQHLRKKWQIQGMLSQDEMQQHKATDEPKPAGLKRFSSCPGILELDSFSKPSAANDRSALTDSSGQTSNDSVVEKQELKTSQVRPSTKISKSGENRVDNAQSIKEIQPYSKDQLRKRVCAKVGIAGSKRVGSLVKTSTTQVPASKPFRFSCHRQAAVGLTPGQAKACEPSADGVGSSLKSERTQRTSRKHRQSSAPAPLRKIPPRIGRWTLREQSEVAKSVNRDLLHQARHRTQSRSLTRENIESSTVSTVPTSKRRATRQKNRFKGKRAWKEPSGAATTQPPTLTQQSVEQKREHRSLKSVQRQPNLTGVKRELITSQKTFQEKAPFSSCPPSGDMFGRWIMPVVNEIESCASYERLRNLAESGSHLHRLCQVGVEYCWEVADTNSTGTDVLRARAEIERCWLAATKHPDEDVPGSLSDFAVGSRQQQQVIHTVGEHANALENLSLSILTSSASLLSSKSSAIDIFRCAPNLPTYRTGQEDRENFSPTFKGLLSGSKKELQVISTTPADAPELPRLELRAGQWSKPVEGMSRPHQLSVAPCSKDKQPQSKSSVTEGKQSRKSHAAAPESWIKRRDLSLQICAETSNPLEGKQGTSSNEDRECTSADTSRDVFSKGEESWKQGSLRQTDTSTWERPRLARRGSIVLSLTPSPTESGAAIACLPVRQGKKLTAEGAEVSWQTIVTNLCYRQYENSLRQRAVQQTLPGHTSQAVFLLPVSLDSNLFLQALPVVWPCCLVMFAVLLWLTYSLIGFIVS